MAPISLPHTFTRRQAIDLGVSDFRLRGMVLRGEVATLRAGVYTRREEATHEAGAAHHLDRARAALDHTSRQSRQCSSHVGHPAWSSTTVTPHQSLSTRLTDWS